MSKQNKKRKRNESDNNVVRGVGARGKEKELQGYGKAKSKDLVKDSTCFREKKLRASDGKQRAHNEDTKPDTPKRTTVIS